VFGNTVSTQASLAYVTYVASGEVNRKETEIKIPDGSYFVLVFASRVKSENLNEMT